MELAYAIAGGGLQGTLLALAIRARQPAATIALVERDPALGGNHLWSFHAADVPDGARRLIAPLVVQRWPAYRVAFPDGARQIALPYATISSERLEAVARATLGDAITRGTVVRTFASGLQLEDGRVLRARLVIDARGPLTLQAQGAVAFQKFAGVELRVACAPRLPTLMDACVEQRDGFRFVYLLPLAPDRVLVEDTRFSLSPTLDVAQVEEDALAYASEHGLSGEMVRREHGVLPLPLDALPVHDDGVLRAGYGGAFFHPTTGYSFPAALRLALHVASRPPEQALDAAFLRVVEGLRRQQRFCLLLNRLLYRAVPEAERWRVLARFHQLPEDTIARFYALQMTGKDRARIVCGRPPRGVSLRAAFRELRA